MTGAPTRLAELIDPDSTLTRLGGGFGFTEGPVWVAADDCLLFSDIPGDARWRWTAERGMELVARPTFKANGMCLDVDGNLLVCEHVSRLPRSLPWRDARAACVSLQGAGILNSPNDVVTRAADGSIYITDPASGRRDDRMGRMRSRDLDFQGVFRLAPGEPELELALPEDEFERPNGLCFSPDESVLYINDSGRGTVKAFDVGPDGSLSNGRVLHEGIGTGVPGSGNVDGMECDELGNIWVTGPGGAWVLTPEGEHLGTIATPAVAGSLSFGGADRRTLFLMTSDSVHSVGTTVRGARLPPG